MFVTETSVNFCPGTVGMGAATVCGADADAVGFGAADTLSRSLDVMEPSNPEPEDTEAKEMPFSAANLRANGDANILSDVVVAAGVGGGTV